MNVFILVGLLINLSMSLINRFVRKIPSKIAIPIYIVGIACLITGLATLKVA